jgi:Sugar (and other) transporter
LHKGPKLHNVLACILRLCLALKQSTVSGGFDSPGGKAVEPGDAQSSGPGVLQLLTKKTVILGIFLFLLQQFSGINAIVYFSSSVFAKVRGPFSPTPVNGG